MTPPVATAEHTAEARPSDRAMKAAVNMEAHAALSTRTDAKAAALDDHFPGYDEMLEALKRLVANYDSSAPSNGIWAQMREFGEAYGQAKAAIAKAEGRQS